MNEITSPLRLSVGSHAAGTGRGCAMNVVSWENGDTTITDFPACSDRFLARLVQRVNDSICTHRDGDLLCPECSAIVLNLAHRTVGTSIEDRPAKERARVYAEIALRFAVRAEKVRPSSEVRRLNATTRAFLDGAATREELRKVRAAVAAVAAADAAVAAAAAAAANAAADAVAAGDAAVAAAAYAAVAAVAAGDAAVAAGDAAAAAAAYAAAAVAAAAYADSAIDLFRELANTSSAPVSEATTQAALTKMLATR